MTRKRPEDLSLQEIRFLLVEKSRSSRLRLEHLHRTQQVSPFLSEYLDRLNTGDIVILLTSQRQDTYVIKGTQMVEPTAGEVMAPTPDARVTLISCHPNLVGIHRIVVSAMLQSS